MQLVIISRCNSSRPHLLLMAAAELIAQNPSFIVVFTAPPALYVIAAIKAKITVKRKKRQNEFSRSFQFKINVPDLQDFGREQ